MSTKYGDRDYERGERDYGRRSDYDDDRSSRERSQGRYRYSRDDDDRERYPRESRWGGGRYGSSRSGSEYGSSQSRGSQYGGGQYGSRERSWGRGREGYRPGSESDWDYTDDRESRFGSFMRGYDTGSYDDTSSGYAQRYNYPTGFRSGETRGERGRSGYDYDYGRGGRYGEERGWLDRLADKLAAWFGDEDAERRSRMGEGYQRQRGKGPKSYRRSDERIREDVNDRLSEGYLDASEIEVLVAEGVVTLTGTVNSRSDKRRAEDIADDVSGVKNVENRLRVQQSDIDRYPSMSGTSSTMGTTGTTGSTGTTGMTGPSDTSSSATTGSTGSTGAARGRTAGSQS